MTIPVILSGGTGSRLWPLSREDFPKQFLPLVNEKSLLQNTILRAQELLPQAESIVITCLKEHSFILQRQLKTLPNINFETFLEPCAKNTAPIVAVIAQHIYHTQDDELMWVMPADHSIQATATLKTCLALAEKAAALAQLVCFGIKATHPSDAYGYIEKGTETPLESCFKINKFIEKPDKKEAKKLLASGCFFWNSGLLLFKPSVFLKELETHAPILYQQTQKAYQSLQNNAPKHYQIPLKAFESIKDISVDYALLEKTKQHVLIPCNTPWSDIGAWDTLKNALPADAQGNVTRGQVITQGVKDSYIHATKRLVTAIGVENHIIVETADAVLVANQKDAQAVKTMVTTLKKQQQPVATKNLKVYRPWGRFETLTIGPRFHVKHIYVNPGASLSLQKHLHRAEHWVIVSGTAEVQKGEDVFILSENQSNYIPIGEVHRLKNIGKIPLELIEVQTGSYLGEDDIIRLEDRYGRVAKQPPIKIKSTT